MNHIVKNIYSINGKVKNVSEVRKYEELRIKYYNSYSPFKKENQKF